jgi:hypothetical protein
VTTCPESGEIAWLETTAYEGRIIATIAPMTQTITTIGRRSVMRMRDTEMRILCRSGPDRAAVEPLGRELTRKGGIPWVHRRYTAATVSFAANRGRSLVSWCEVHFCARGLDERKLRLLPAVVRECVVIDRADE